MNKTVISCLKNNKIYYLVFLVLALLVLFPLLKPGYVLVMDMIFTPKIRCPEVINTFQTSLCLLSQVLPSQLIQKVLLFSVLFLSGIGMYKLIPGKNIWPKYFAGFFYALNPFIYSRFLYGHLGLLLGYAILPFAVKSIFILFNHFKWSNFLKVLLFLILTGIVSAHIAFMLLLFFVIYSTIYFFRKKGKLLQRINFFKSILIVAVLCVIVSAFLIYNNHQKATIISNFNQNDLEAFKTLKDDNFGYGFNVLSLYGFWGDQQGHYLNQKYFAPYWYILAIVIFALVICGSVAGFKSSHLQIQIKVKTFIIVAIIAFVLSIGISSSPFSLINQFLYNNFPLYYGFREPQKFVALLCFSFSFLAAIGLQSLSAILINRKKEILCIIISVFVAAVPFMYSPGLLWGFRGQIYTSEYPNEWYEANQYLNKDIDDFKVLFLPWHQYMKFNFAHRVIANPASIFFDKETIAGDNMQLDEIETQSNRAESQYIEDILRKKETINDFGERLKKLRIKYVILAKETDYIYYTNTFLDRQTDLEIVYDKNSIKIYKNTILAPVDK